MWSPSFRWIEHDTRSPRVYKPLFGRWQSRLTNREARISVSSRIPFVPVRRRNDGSRFYRDSLRFRSRDVYRETVHAGLIFVSTSCPRLILPLSILPPCNPLGCCINIGLEGTLILQSFCKANRNAFFRKTLLPFFEYIFCNIFLINYNINNLKNSKTQF